jgi:WD40 repeat protein
MKRKRIKLTTSTTLSEVFLSRINNAIVFSPDGRALALAYRDGTVALWDLGADADAEAFEALVMRGHAGAIADLSFSPDGNWLASASLDRTARLWRLQTANRPRLEQSDRGPATHAISKDGSYLITGGQIDGKLQLWAGSSLRPLQSINTNAQPNDLAIIKDGTRAFVGTDQGDLLLWNTNDSQVRVIPKGSTGAISAIALSPDESFLAAIGVNGKNLQLCHVDKSEPDCSTIPGLAGWGHAVAFSEDNRWLGAASDVDENTGLALVLDLDAKSTTFLKGHSAGISSIQIDGKKKRAVTSSWDGTVRIWDLSSGKELVRLKGPRGHTVTAGFTPDGHSVATGSFVEKSIRLWEIPEEVDGDAPIVKDSNAGRLVLDSLDFNSIVFDPSGNILVS